MTFCTQFSIWKTATIRAINHAVIHNKNYKSTLSILFMYNLIFEKSALESLNKLEPQIKERIWNKLQQCKENPFRFLEHLE